MHLKDMIVMSLKVNAALASILILASQLVEATQLSVGIEHDMSKPTYGLHGQSSSAVTYDDKNGLNLKGNINDILGPPIKMMNGIGNIMAGSGMAGLGTSLKTGGALLGIDAKLLEAAGATHLVKGGLLFGGAAAKTGLATALGGLPGKKISSIIELPVKVVALKDLATGKALAGMGKLKEVDALAHKAKGATMIKAGDALKAQGFNQVMQGATEGMTNFGNMVQQTAGNAATAYKLLPIILDLPTGQEQHSEQRAESGVQQTIMGPLSGGSLFGGMSSLLPNMGSNDPFSQLLGGGVVGSGQGKSSFNLFGNQNQNHNGYAAVLNSTHPLTNLLMNPSLNPLLYPLNNVNQYGRPSTGSRLPFGFGLGLNQLIGQPGSSNFNLFPGIRVSESSSGHQQGYAQSEQQAEAPKG